MTVRDLITALGGPAAVARALRVSTEAVCNWRLRGCIPRRQHLALWRLAREAGVDWRPPGAEDIDIIVHRSQADADAPAEFAQCSGAPR